MHRLSGRILLIAAAFALFLVPVAAIAAGGFTDVDDDSVFKADIAWLADAGVTKGCNPPTNDKFCPEGNVTREQMAAFMHRLAVNKVVDAKTAVTAINAINADKLDGKDSTAFAGLGHNHDVAYLAIGGEAADADKLDGKDSTAFAASGHDHDAAYLATTGKAADSDELDGFSVEDIVPRASGTTFYVAGGSYVAEFVASVTIDAPVRGVIIATATGDTYFGTGSQTCFMYLDETSFLGGQGYVDHSQDNEADCTTSGSIVVDPGVHTIDMWFSGDAIHDGALWAMWVPFDGTGAVPASAGVLGSVELDEKYKK